MKRDEVSSEKQPLAAIAGQEPDRLVDNLSGSFGREILTKSAANWAGRTIELRERGKLSVAAGTAVLGAGAGRRSRGHVFHGRETR
jgi:hypothetical protein